MGEKRIVRRAQRIRAKLAKTFPRLSVFRSNKYIRAQIIDDKSGNTLAAVSGRLVNREERESRQSVAHNVGELIAQLAVKKRITRVVFDRGPYKYHGVIRQLAEGARKGGLKF